MSVNLKTVYTCFPEGNHKALTMSYDDGKEEDRRLVQIFNKYGIKSTFNLNSGTKWEGKLPLEECCQLYEGHEIASHTHSHPTLTRCSTEQIISEVMEDRKVLEKIAGYPVRGFAYPNGAVSEQVKTTLAATGIQYGRIVGNSEEFYLPDDYMMWKATCHHNYNLKELGEKFVALSKVQYLNLMYVWGHSYEFSMNNNWSIMEEFCEMVGNKKNIWYATNIQIFDYMEAAKRLQFAVDSSFVYNPSIQSVWLSVNGKIIESVGGKLTILE